MRHHAAALALGWLVVVGTGAAPAVADTAAGLTRSRAIEIALAESPTIVLRGGASAARRPTMLYIVKSPKPLDLVARDLEAAVAHHKFGVLGVHDLRAKMAEKGVPFGRECRVFEVCNPHQARKVLEANLEISTALPCRISIYEEAGQTVLATIKPTAMIALYRNPELRAVAEEVEATLEGIMTEAAGGTGRADG